MRAAAMTSQLLRSRHSPLYTDAARDAVWDLARDVSLEIDAARGT